MLHRQALLLIGNCSVSKTLVCEEYCERQQKNYTAREMLYLLAILRMLMMA